MTLLHMASVSSAQIGIVGAIKDSRREGNSNSGTELLLTNGAPDSFERTAKF